MKIIFMGSSTFAIPSLMTLLKEDFEIMAVYTQPPQRAGRGKNYREVPVSKYAKSHGLKIIQPKNFDKSAVYELKQYEPDFIVVVSYGVILPKIVLDIPSKIPINVHGSLLPRWRGASPINYTIFNRDLFSGVSIIRMSEKLDSGPILKQEKVKLDGTETFGTLHKLLSDLGAKNLLETLNNFNEINQVEQKEEMVSYAPKIAKRDTMIDFKEPTSVVDAHIRGLSPVPGAWFEYRNERFKVYKTKKVNAKGVPGSILDEDLTIACGDGALKILEIQRQGKNIMNVSKLTRGYKFQKGDFVT